MPRFSTTAPCLPRLEARDKMETHRSIVVEVAKVFCSDMTPEYSDNQPKEGLVESEDDLELRRVQVVEYVANEIIVLINPSNG
jgi:hypothetical protein